ncbi:DUF3667 domain-containing protein [Persicitalea jodogahamensis]|uniref:DUF3667 domain-containing protein n=1 Tax=Persicitalea jodogahamensis TaxID=402147 RepID=A0A8J3D5A5_9BACT|nr:DUF3667 domain-containing protein [Persicitalea jodogahamensis]GHB76503.1 hypothetical protein GCM10007390_33050 [Persicitalea jodogahamensis]
MSANCLNCGTHLQDSYKYCPSCSQKKDTHRIHFHDLLHDAVHYVTHADKGFLYLLRSLATSTGVVAREYVEGKRKKYFPPLNFYLIVAGLFVLTMTTLEKPPTDVEKENPRISQITDPVEKQRVIRIYERKAVAMHFTAQYSNLLAFIAIPIIALIYWLFYMKASYNYIEHLIAGMYMNGFTNLLYILLFVPITRLLAGEQSSRFLGVYFLGQLVYSGIFYYKFINRTGKAALAKAFGATLLTLVVWVAGTSFAISQYISTGFWGLVK